MVGVASGVGGGGGGGRGAGGGGGGGDLLGGVLGGGGGGLLGGVLGGGGGGGGLLGGVLGGGGGLLGGVLGGGGGGGGGGGLLGGVLGGGGGGGLLGGVLGGGGGGLLGGGGGSPQGGGGGNGAKGGFQAPQLDGGILGNGGLLGNLFGGNGGGALGILGNGGLLGTVQGLTGLRIMELTLPKVSLKLLPGIGVYLNVYTRVAINGKSLLGFLDIDVEVNITAKTRLTQESSGVPRLILEDCNMLLGGIHIGLLKGLLAPILDGLVNNLLRNVLPGLLCPVVNVVLDLVDGLLVTVNTMVPLGILGSIQYTVSALPLVTGKFIELDVNALVSTVGGGLIDYPLGNVKPIVMPPMADASSSQLGLSTNFLGCVLAALQKDGLLDVVINDGDLPSLPPLSTAVLSALVPKVGLMYPDPRPLVIKLKVPSPPKVTLKKNKGSVTMRAKTEVFASMPDTSCQSLFVLDVVVEGRFGPMSWSKARLPKAQKTVVFKEFLDLQVSATEGLIAPILDTALLPTLNAVIGNGIPLPKLMNINFDDANIDIIEGFQDGRRGDETQVSALFAQAAPIKHFN
ncbi:BPI fold-containing family B member 4-like [Ambystoma mexicanum]|uniref:BPI fold-containing family B member 4-like n=1 Tax=Ambystoma mexicanum TaxID=8296 RepID=UPI0037E9A268